MKKEIYTEQKKKIGSNDEITVLTPMNLINNINIYRMKKKKSRFNKMLGIFFLHTKMRISNDKYIADKKKIMFQIIFDD